MASSHDRAHGVTPGLRRDYGQRTAERQAAFVLPYLQPGMNLLDLGCGPGSITVGLARAVAPGDVIGIDHDSRHIEAARARAAAQGVDNVLFRKGNVLTLPFPDDSFDVVFENDLFVHLARGAAQAARDVYRILKPHGFFAARDADAAAAVWGHASALFKQLDQSMIAWQQRRGSDITLGRQLPKILREAGFANIIKSVSADTKGTPASVRSHADITLSLLDGPLGKDMVEHGAADSDTIARLKATVQAWAEHPDAFFANIHVEVMGWKSDENPNDR